MQNKSSIAMKKMKIFAIVEARMTSSRLPGKVLLKADGKPMLEHLITRLKSVKLLTGIVLATTTNHNDDVLEDFSNKHGIELYRGSEDDVMMRVIKAAESVKADIVVEITGDCPVIDPQLVEQTIKLFKANDVDYVSNNNIKSYPDGMDTQVFWLDALKKSASMTNDKLDHEHVTLHIRSNPNLFSQLNLVAPPEIDWPELGLTLDEKDDYILLKKIIEFFGPQKQLFSCLDIVQFLKKNPDLVSINNTVIRKGDT
tara:strand:- start:458 stop:1225 length:768 start_codon:yes stop_codon:yes gene_type:complete